MYIWGAPSPLEKAFLECPHTACTIINKSYGAGSLVPFVIFQLNLLGPKFQLYRIIVCFQGVWKWNLKWVKTWTRWNILKVQFSWKAYQIHKFVEKHVHQVHWWRKHICGALSDLVPFVQFKNHEKRSWRSVNFRKVTGFSLQLY